MGENNHTYGDILRQTDHINELIHTLKATGRITTKNISDTYHTFGELYHHRAILFSIIVANYSSISWKTWKHHPDDKPIFDGMFLVGIDTPNGQYSYHYNPEYWDLFNCKVLDNAPLFDNHTPDDIDRLLSLV